MQQRSVMQRIVKKIHEFSQPTPRHATKTVCATPRKPCMLCNKKCVHKVKKIHEFSLRNHYATITGTN